MPSNDLNHRQQVWQAWRLKNRPPVARACVGCGTAFYPSGPQKRCDTCRTSVCGHCGKKWIAADGHIRAFCSRRCSALGHPEVIQSLQENRGVKPRTYAARHRDKHGSAEDRDWRTAVFERDAYVCRDCGVKGGRLQAHHIKAFKAHPELRHDLDNGLTLCVECHKKTDTYGWANYWRSQIAARRLEQGVLDLGVAR